MKNKERKEAINLRKQGWSYASIAKEIGVAKSTLSIWLSDLQLTDEQKRALGEKCRIASVCSGRKNKKRWDKLKQEVREVYVPPFDDPEFMLGLGLYWGEGDKGNQVGLANSDINIIKHFMLWCKKYLEVENFSAMVHHYTPDRDNEIKIWWSKNLKLSLDQFYQSNFSVSLKSQKKRNTLKFGTIKIRAKGKQIWKAKVKINKAMNMMKFAEINL